MKTILYINIIDANIHDNLIGNRLIELITVDIQKTKLKYNFLKLKNIYIIVKIIKHKYVKIVLFYDGLLSNKKSPIIENNLYSGGTPIYKLNLKNKIFSHYLQ